jgi:hypothetical protein
MRPSRWILALAAGASLLLGSDCDPPRNVIYLAPANQTVVVDQIVALDLWMNFMDATWGGGARFTWDPARLELLGFTFAPDFPDDPTFRVWCPDIWNLQCLNDPGFWDAEVDGVVGFAEVFEGGVQGHRRIGTLLFRALSAGGTTVATREEDKIFTAPFFSTSGQTLASVGYRSATLQIAP